MHFSSPILLIAAGLFLVAAPAHGQIRDTEGSATLLAMNCSASSGFSASGYEEYSRRLARTIGVLSGEQQRRVFGYLPTPVETTTATPTTEPTNTTTDSGGIASTPRPAPTTENSTAGTPGSSTPAPTSGTEDSTNVGNTGTNPGIVEQVVNTTNNIVTTGSNALAPTVESTTGIDLGSTTAAVTDTTSQTGSNIDRTLQEYWNSIIQWFQSMQSRQR